MTTQDLAVAPADGEHPSRRGRVKCVVWDLDGTIWDGVLLEDRDVVPLTRIIDIVRALDEVGILNSIASKNDHDAAIARLEEAGIVQYFLYPQIGWNPKSTSVRRIASALNIGIDSLAFVDDQPFELAEVQHALPEVLCVPADEIVDAVRLPEFRPRFVTNESRERRPMYQSSAARDEAEQEFVGTSTEFLATLGMRMRISEAEEGDLQRAEELTVRTNQLNSTGRIFSYEELAVLRTSPDHLLLVASLEDRFGSYGKIGLAVVEKTLAQDSRPSWKLAMLLMSCRVVSRGVGTILLNHVMRLAAADGAPLLAEFVATGRNRMMHVTYMFAGFREVGRDGDAVLLQSTLDRIQAPPSYVDLQIG
jgi:FkbH-like protein